MDITLRTAMLMAVPDVVVARATFWQAPLLPSSTGLTMLQIPTLPCSVTHQDWALLQLGEPAICQEAVLLKPSANMVDLSPHLT